MHSIMYGFYDELEKLAQDGLLDYRPVDGVFSGKPTRLSRKRAIGAGKAIIGDVARPAVKGAGAGALAGFSLSSIVEQPPGPLTLGGAAIGGGLGGVAGLPLAALNLIDRYKAYRGRKSRAANYLKYCRAAANRLSPDFRGG